MSDKKVKKTGEEKQESDRDFEQLKNQVEEYKNKYFRALADYQNLEKRVDGDRENIGKAVQVQLLMKLLPFVDNLDKAEVFVKDIGLKLAKDHLLKIFQEVGLEELDVINKEFDPYTAEVIDLVPGERDNIVVEVLRKGYRLGDRILRVAQVKVSKKVNPQTR